MRRSSVLILIASTLLVAVALAALFASASSHAPPMSRTVARSILDRGKLALEQRDSGGIIALFSRDARVFGRSPSDMHTLIDQAMRELGESPSLTVDYGKLEVSSTDGEARVSVNVEVRQRLPNAEASYYRPRMHLVLRKERVPLLLGLATREEWRIVHLDADQSLDLPPP